jgi:hypothetical protein
LPLGSQILIGGGIAWNRVKVSLCEGADAVPVGVLRGTRPALGAGHLTGTADAAGVGRASPRSELPETP